MADIIIPLPDANGYWHFTYITTDPVDGRWYGGKRSCRKHPTVDRYKGSGRWVKAHPARGRLERTIVAFYASSADVFAAEVEMITWEVVLDDPLCMNKCDGGAGMSVERIQRMHSDPVFRAAYEAGIANRKANPKWKAAQIATLGRLHTDPTHVAAHAAAMVRMAACPEWQKGHRAFIDRRTADPAYREANLAALAKMRADPVHKATHAAALARMHADPTWRVNHRNGSRRRAADPASIANHAAAMKRMAADPIWQKAHAERMRRMHAARRAAKALLIARAS